MSAQICMYTLSQLVCMCVCMCACLLRESNPIYSAHDPCMRHTDVTQLELLHILILRLGHGREKKKTVDRPTDRPDDDAMMIWMDLCVSLCDPPHRPSHHIHLAGHSPVQLIPSNGVRQRRERRRKEKDYAIEIVSMYLSRVYNLSHILPSPCIPRFRLFHWSVRKS